MGGGGLKEPFEVGFGMVEVHAAVDGQQEPAIHVEVELRGFPGDLDFLVLRLTVGDQPGMEFEGWNAGGGSPRLPGRVHP